jgi:lipid-A-disaccharide synthase
MSESPQIMIVAAESSSALYAQRLLEHWRDQKIPVKAFGVGSQAMVDLGFEAIGRSEDMAVMGLWEVLAHFREIRQIGLNLVEEVKRRKPQVILLLDYPGFNLRIAPRLKKLGVPIVYYISPQLWAWKTGRVELVRKFVDRMLVLFPFETEFYRHHNIHADFVGHPLLDEIKKEKWTAEKRRAQRQRIGIEDGQRLIGLMPGSRRSELKYNLSEQLKAAEILYRQDPNTKFAWLVAPSFTLDEAKALLPPRYSVPIKIIQAEPLAMIQLCDAMICASGTATLMVGLAEVPMVIMYRMNPFTAFMAKRLVKSVEYFGMVNLVSGRMVVPEVFQEQALAENLAHKMNEILEPTTHQRIQRDLRELPELLGGGRATLNVAEILKPFLQPSNPG